MLGIRAPAGRGARPQGARAGNGHADRELGQGGIADWGIGDTNRGAWGGNLETEETNAAGRRSGALASGVATHRTAINDSEDRGVGERRGEAPGPDQRGVSRRKGPDILSLMTPLP